MKRKFWLNNPYSLQEFSIYFKEHVTCFHQKKPTQAQKSNGSQIR